MNENDIYIGSLIDHFSVYGDEKSYKLIFEKVFPSLKRFAFCFLKSWEQAEEAASDVMISVWQNRYKLAKIDNIKVYLFVLAKNRCLNILKSKRNKETISLEEININIVFRDLDPEQLCINSEILRKVERTINSLPQRCKLIFKLVKEERMSYKEVADILDISVKTVDAQLVTALKKITTEVKLAYIS